MDGYLDPLLTSSSWSDVNTEESSFWDCQEPDHLNGLLPSSVGSYESDKEISMITMIDSSHTESLASQESSSVVPGGTPDYGLDNGLLLGEAQPPQDGHHHEGDFSLNGAVNGSSIMGYMGLPLDTVKSTLRSLNHGSVLDLPVVGKISRPSRPCPESDKVRCYGSELSGFQRTCRDFQSLPPIPQLWTPSSYEGDTSFPPMEKDNIQGFDLQGAYAESEIYAVGNRYVRNNKTMQLDNLSVAVPMKGKEELQNLSLSSFVPQPQRTMTTAGLQSPSQTASALPSGNCIGAGKPRVRARRGQATDPHSIAERLRREKIAEGMKHLQELVPDNNKTDKASMLDEIIEYVKFLQLQVKVLSMSRLGAAEAVVPLITDSQTEGSNGLLLSPSADQVLDSSLSTSEQSTLEGEVVKLMESNITMAIQYLQRKGLCLMPIALATAISSGKRSSSGPGSDERNKFEWSDSPHCNRSCSNLSGVSHQMCPDGCDVNGRLGNGSIRVNGCNEAVLKVEDMNNGSQTVKEVKPKT